MLGVLVDDRQLEAPALQPLQIEREAVAVPEEDLHLVLRLADEDEEMAAQRVLLQRAFDMPPKAVDPLSHVDQLRGELHTSGTSSADDERQQLLTIFGGRRRQ